MLTLFKFRSLGDDDSLRRAIQILETGEFWCSKLWDMNDPMEGVFIGERTAISASVFSRVFSEKNKCVICSFSAERAFKSPSMWGYYANGFKGIAVEIEVDKKEVHRVKYAPDVAKWITLSGRATDKTRMKRVLTTKWRSWRIEHEYRFIAESHMNCSMRIGRVKGVHFGWPYKDVRNVDDVMANSEPLRDYVKRVRILFDTANNYGIPCFAAYTIGSEVESVPFSLASLP